MGQLPWRRLSDKTEVLEMKLKTDYWKILEKCPSSFKTLMEHLETLDFYAKPDYGQLIDNFRRDLRDLHVREKDPLDWERPKEASELSMKTPGTPCPTLMEDRSQEVE